MVGGETTQEMVLRPEWGGGSRISFFVCKIFVSYRGVNPRFQVQ
jgi:hypothetical protein